MMLFTACLKTLVLVQVVLAQAPFSLEDTPVHYLTLSDGELPIELNQYFNDLVVRVKYDNDDIKKFLFGPGMKRWGRNNVQSTVDIQLDEGKLVEMIEKFPDVKYDVVIEDLAQLVFESYPDDFSRQKHEQFNKRGSGYKWEITEKIMAVFENGKSEAGGNDFTNTAFTAASELFFKDYRPLESIEAWLEIIAQTYSKVVNIETIGHTHEGRPYNVVHLLAYNEEIEHKDKKTIVITGGVHAREWISTSSVLYSLYELLIFHDQNPDSKEMAHLDFLFIPVLNPDGYEYSWTHDRLWRKNRQQTVNPNCIGIDIDHSYDYHWTKSTDWECGEEYAGEKPFEAIESRIWDEYLLNSTHKQIHGYIDLHSYAQEVLFPYAYSCSLQPRDEENLIELAYGIAKVVRLTSGESYNVLPACIDRDLDLLPDLGAGSALDFMYHNRAYWAYQFKLRDSGSHGFLLPAKYIVPVGEEIAAGIKYFIEFLLRED